MHQGSGGSYQNGGLFLGHSLIIIKWTWGFFPKTCKLIPPTIRQKRVTVIDISVTKLPLRLSTTTILVIISWYCIIGLICHK